MKTHEQNRNNKRPEIERFDWFIESGFWLVKRTRVKQLHAPELSRNQLILLFDIILQHDWPIEQCFFHIRFFFGGKTKTPCFDLLIEQITINTYWNHFSRSYKNILLLYLDNTVECNVLKLTKYPKELKQ